jgi:hypothetical protein
MTCDDPLVVIATSTSSTTRPRSGYRGSDFVLWHNAEDFGIAAIVSGS